MNFSQTSLLYSYCSTFDSVIYFHLALPCMKYGLDNLYSIAEKNGMLALSEKIFPIRAGFPISQNKLGNVGCPRKSVGSSFRIANKHSKIQWSWYYWSVFVFSRHLSQNTRRGWRSCGVCRPSTDSVQGLQVSIVECSGTSTQTWLEVLKRMYNRGMMHHLGHVPKDLLTENSTNAGHSTLYWLI